MTSKRRTWLMVLLGLIPVIASFAYFARKREPIYHGKTVREWVVIHYHDQLARTPLGRESAEAMRAFGTNALPTLLECVAFDPSRKTPRFLVGQLLLKLPFVSPGSTIGRWCKFVDERNLAVATPAAFGVLGTNAQPAIPQLVRLMNSTNHPDTGFVAILALRAIGEPSVPALLAQLANTNAPNRPGVALAFATYPHLLTNNTEVVAQLLSCLDEADPILVERAALALAAMAQSHGRPPPDLILPALIERLPRTTGPTQTSLMHALSAYGAHARDAVPVLREMLNDQDESIRSRAATALQVITNTPPRY